jgi:hypothetical protein
VGVTAGIVFLFIHVDLVLRVLVEQLRSGRQDGGLTHREERPETPEPMMAMRMAGGRTRWVGLRGWMCRGREEMDAILMFVLMCLKPTSHSSFANLANAPVQSVIEPIPNLAIASLVSSVVKYIRAN